MGDWQPIETAPRDGTVILAVMTGYAPVVVFWNRQVGWLEPDDDPLDYEPYGWALDYWMPLPPPPTTVKPEQVQP